LLDEGAVGVNNKFVKFMAICTNILGKLEVVNCKVTFLVASALINRLIKLIYQFSRMYWKSENQQHLPTTSLCPEIVAEMNPHFENENLSDFGKNILWFL
jgi:hypothetical protein